MSAKNKIPNAYSQAVMRRMKALRQQRGWSQSELAQRLCDIGCDVALHKISNYDAGRQKVVSIDFAFAVAEVFGVAVEDLIKTPCGTCNGAPPSGFACKDCGRG